MLNNESLEKLKISIEKLIEANEELESKNIDYWNHTDEVIQDTKDMVCFREMQFKDKALELLSLLEK